MASPVTYRDGEVADTFVKLYRSIITSSVWLETLPTKVVWITMLASADWRGNVWASVKGLAHAAGVSVKDCETALDVLSSPDPDSRTKDQEGRRILPIDGGWNLINHSKYREFRTPTQVRTAERTRRYRARKQGVTGDDVTVRDAQIEKQNQIEIERQKERTTFRPSADVLSVWSYFLEKTNYKPRTSKAIEAGQRRISARLKEGSTPEDLRRVVDFGLFDEHYVLKGYYKQSEVLFKNAARIESILARIEVLRERPIPL